MMICSELARSICPDRDTCGFDEKGDYGPDSWCDGFNEGVKRAYFRTVDFSPIVRAAAAGCEALTKLAESGEFAALLKNAIEKAKGEEV